MRSAICDVSESVRFQHARFPRKVGASRHRRAERSTLLRGDRRENTLVKVWRATVVVHGVLSGRWASPVYATRFDHGASENSGRQGRGFAEQMGDALLKSIAEYLARATQGGN